MEIVGGVKQADEMKFAVPVLGPPEIMVMGLHQEKKMCSSLREDHKIGGIALIKATFHHRCHPHLITNQGTSLANHEAHHHTRPFWTRQSLLHQNQFVGV